MNIGDRVRDKGTQFVGTVVQLDPSPAVAPGSAASVIPTRCLIQADPPASGKVGDPPPDKMWQAIDQVELIDMTGNPVAGKAGQKLDAPAGKATVDASRDATAKKPGAGATAT